jgi:xanthine dehydrogenase YagR molybdenum-binding subunit
MAAQLVAGRPVKLALTRQQMFSLVGYRTPTIQRIQLGTDIGGRLVAIAHDVVEQTARAKDYAEQTAVCSRVMYAAPNRRTTHRLAPLDVPVPTIMRAPGEAPGMYALESAMDEMALACGLDPVEFRIRNEPDADPETGQPFSSRNLVACLREGARRFGWGRRDRASRARHDRGWLVGTGVAASTYPSLRLPGSAATIRVGPDRYYTVLIGAADIGTGAWTALTQIAADALGVAVERVRLRIGDTTLPAASPAGYSSGTASWGTAIVEAAGKLRARLDAEHGTVPVAGLEVTASMPDNPNAARFSMRSFGAQFAEVRVHEETGEIRVPRLLGVFDAGRVINPKTARSQLLGGMTQGLSMALHERSVVDPRYGHVVNRDLAGYHIATNADVGSVEVHWIDEDDPYVNPMGAKGIGEVGIVGTAAAIANATYHATGIRVRNLPITLDKLLR